ncbi:uncharacterized protein FOMMEDRAFT_20785 [Fomitiporia mediterranea MF3/22]|uniref:uncharacterized protein n=1 Tax=Fomitiporia mediterranea (strain MF3/22) TaxID=694068 RepID=UPI00044097AE|nr:uncharacterized protein FOMMEDRAFT_20785 [Fomitiporia mediterranea MF3/22]EJD02020.1 hypothetical protein FOMMEDRAFT_20785 [Fomitiporia mediterranea MF3/22]
MSEGCILLSFERGMPCNKNDQEAVQAVFNANPAVVRLKVYQVDPFTNGYYVVAFGLNEMEVTRSEVKKTTREALASLTVDPRVPSLMRSKTLQRASSLLWKFFWGSGAQKVEQKGTMGYA